MLVYVLVIEVFAEKVGTIKIVAKTADHCAVDNYGVDNIHHVRVRQTTAYAEQLHRCARYVSAFSFSLQCVSFSCWWDRVFSWKNLKDKERGKKKKEKERNGERGRERNDRLQGLERLHPLYSTWKSCRRGGCVKGLFEGKRDRRSRVGKRTRGVCFVKWQVA